MKNWFMNIVLILSTFLLTILFFEFIVFRYILVASYVPENLFDKNGVIKYLPNQTGVYREKNEIKTHININRNGWNSKHNYYEITKHDKKRIVIIGDSYVEALMVDYNNSMTEQLENKLGEQYEVYRFAISGAPLSQYLYMLRKEVLLYKPEIVVFVLVHNDFDESWSFVPGRYTSSFMKFKIEEGKVVKELPPQQYINKWYQFIRTSATYRYLVDRQKVNIAGIKDLILGTGKKEKAVQYQANVDVKNLKSKIPNNNISVDYFLNQINLLSKKYKFEPIIIIDGNRDSIYKNLNTDDTTGIFYINSYLALESNKKNIKFSDLNTVFKEDYKKYKIKFNSKVDNHWNQYGHKVVSDELYRLITGGIELNNSKTVD